MDLTLSQMVGKAVGQLNQFVTNRPQTATFQGFGPVETDGSTPINLAPSGGVNTLLGEALVEVGHELMHVTNFSTQNGRGALPPWGRAQLGTAEYTPTVGDKVTVNPLWPYWHVAEQIIDGIDALYPSLFQAKSVTLQSRPLSEQYEVPDDFEDVLDLRIEWWGTIRPQRPLTRYSVDRHMTDGKRYLFVPVIGVGGRPLHLTYKARPAVPADPTEADWLFSDSGLPKSAVDLPVLHAVKELIVSAELAKTQNYSAEQSDRNRFVQSGASTAASRRLEELYQTRRLQEQRKLMQRYPVRVHHKFNG